ncbi:CDP-diacylglycerol--serine O-phosphatidyltransferase [bacterium]|nr:CDP-diacylglycerol--serine O-phosphatidyltransferase [bacterium]
MRKIYILPNMFTSASLFCGMWAIFTIYNNNGSPNPGAIQEACWLIVFSAFLDVMDGFIARLTRTQSFFGLNLDSLSDLVAFGVAPALMAYDVISDTVPQVAAITVCAFYVICGALRLARFNVQATREESKTFLGLPIPGAALALISIVWVFDTIPLEQYLEVVHLNLDKILTPLVVVLGSLMVSKVPYVGFKSFNLAHRQPFEILVTIVIVGSLLFMMKQNLNILLMVGIWSYIVIGLLLLPLRHMHPKSTIEPDSHPRP